MPGLMERIAVAKDLQQKVEAERQARSEADSVRTALLFERDRVAAELVTMAGEVEEAENALNEAKKLEDGGELDPEVKTIIEEVRAEAQAKQTAHLELQKRLSAIDTELAGAAENEPEAKKTDAVTPGPSIEPVVEAPAQEQPLEEPPIEPAEPIHPRTNGPAQVREMLGKLERQPGMARTDAINEFLDVLTKGMPFKNGEPPAIETIDEAGLGVLADLVNELAESGRLAPNTIKRYALAIRDALTRAGAR